MKGGRKVRVFVNLLFVELSQHFKVAAVGHIRLKIRTDWLPRSLAGWSSGSKTWKRSLTKSRDDLLMLRGPIVNILMMNVRRFQDHIK